MAEILDEKRRPNVRRALGIPHGERVRVPSWRLGRVVDDVPVAPLTYWIVEVDGDYWHAEPVVEPRRFTRSDGSTGTRPTVVAWREVDR